MHSLRVLILEICLCWSVFAYNISRENAVFDIISLSTYPLRYCVVGVLTVSHDEYVLE